jgi:hypothetical protein
VKGIAGSVTDIGITVTYIASSGTDFPVHLHTFDCVKHIANKLQILPVTGRYRHCMARRVTYIASTGTDIASTVTDAASTRSDCRTVFNTVSEDKTLLVHKKAHL